MKTDKRIEWIDILRGFSMILIVFGHVLVHCDKLRFLYQYIYSFHVPMFFFISGYLSSIKNYDNFFEFFKKKFKRIMIPYFIFAILFLIPYAIMGQNVNLGDEAELNLKKSIIGIIYGNADGVFLRQNSPLWFLPCLFIVELLSYGVNKFIAKQKENMGEFKTLIFCLIFFIIIGYIDYKFNCVKIFWGIDTALVMMYFFIIGMIMKRKDLKVIVNKRGELIVAFLEIIIGAIMQIFNGEVACMGFYFGHNFAVFLISASFSIIGYTSLIKVVGRNKILKEIGIRTMGILVFHKIMVVVFQSKLGIISEQLTTGNICVQLILAIVITFITILLTFLPTDIIRKICPMLLGEKS